MSFLSTISQWLVETLEPYGAPGLMLIAIGDSSFLSLPEVNDAALMALSINNPVRMWELAAMTVLGSIIGCSLLYAVGRRGGEALLQKRFASDKVAKVRNWYQRFGMLAVIVPSLLPPPLPFKIFVLSAGAFQISWLRFITAVAIGRSIRYFAEGLLAVWYGKRAIQIVADNVAIVGIVLAALIVAAAVIYVFFARRRKVGQGVIMSLLLVVLGQGCIKTVPQTMLPSYPFSKEEALQKLENISMSISSVDTSIRLSGSTVSLKDANKRLVTPVSLNGRLSMERGNRIFLMGSVPIAGRVFEMVSDGTDYQVYNNHKEELYVGGKEDGPPAKPIPQLDDLANKFVGMKPKWIHEALMINVIPLLRNPSIKELAHPLPLTQDRKKYFVVDFVDTSSAMPHLVTQIWFDLSTPNIDVVRRLTFTASGDLDTDTQYTGYESLSTTLRYPSRFEIELHDTDTSVKIELDPKQATFNSNIPAERFQFDPHPGAKIIKFEPRAATASNTVARQQ